MPSAGAAEPDVRPSDESRREHRALDTATRHHDQQLFFSTGDGWRRRRHDRRPGLVPRCCPIPRSDEAALRLPLVLVDRGPGRERSGRCRRSSTSIAGDRPRGLEGERLRRRASPRARIRALLAAGTRGRSRTVAEAAPRLASRRSVGGGGADAHRRQASARRRRRRLRPRCRRVLSIGGRRRSARRASSTVDRLVISFRHLARGFHSLEAGQRPTPCVPRSAARTATHSTSPMSRSSPAMCPKTSCRRATAAPSCTGC